MSVWQHLHKAVLIDNNTHAQVTLSGSDHLALLHRLSTQACAQMQQGQSCLNALLTPKGRLVDLVHQIALPNGATLLLGGHNRQEPLHHWLDQHIFTEDAHVTDARSDKSVWLLTGNTALELLDGMLQHVKELLPWQHRIHNKQLVMRTFDHVDEREQRVPTCLLRLCGNEGRQLLRQLRKHSDVHEASEGEANTLRIGAGIPGCPGEINEQHNPLELGLDFVVNQTKGCYVGQEVISRLITYNKVRRQLVRVRVRENTCNVVLQTAAVMQEKGNGSAEYGPLTSVSSCSDATKTQALAMVKLPESIHLPTTATVPIAHSDSIEVELLPVSFGVAG